MNIQLNIPLGKISSILLLSLLASLSACSSANFGAHFGESPASLSKAVAQNKYLKSGTIILSHSLPTRGPTRSSEQPLRLASSDTTTLDSLEVDGSPVLSRTRLSGGRLISGKRKLFAPLIGYFPPAHAYMPADNETWLEVDSKKKTLTLFKGKSAIKEIKGEGSVSLDEGEYYLQHKQKQPLWYAPDDYFKKRKLNIPSPGDRLRYRRGALGNYALYPTTTFPIHCGPIWSKDVGGLRVSATELSSIYYMLPVGAPIVVK